MFLQLIFLSVLILQSSAKVSYEGYQLLRTSIPNVDQKEALESLMKSNTFSFWTLPSTTTPVDILTSADKLNYLVAFLDENNLNYEVKISDVERLVKKSEVKTKKSKDDETEHEFTFDEYHKTDVIFGYFEYLASKYDFVSTEKLGTTYEGRDILGVKIEKAGQGKKNVFIEGMAHGLEWISPAVVAYLIHELVENHETHSHYLDNLNFYSVPILNPDGYDYTHDTDRLWRKTRTEVYSTECKGTDLNRNFPFGYGLTSSDDVCSDLFHGNKSLSEPETIAMSKFYRSIEPTPELGLSYHSAYGIVVYPFSTGEDDFPDNIEEIIELCGDVTEALNEVDGQEFFCIHGGSVGAGGTALDFYASSGSRFSYVTLLRDNGYGVLLPPEFIEPSGREIFASIKVIMDKLLEE